MSGVCSSMSFTDVFILCMMGLIIFMYIRRYYGEVEFMTSKVDGKDYLVRKMPDAQEAADRLAVLNKKLSKLIEHIAAKYKDNADVARLKSKFNPEAVSEGGMENGYTSYSVNKGERIVMCIRQTDGTFVDANVIMYVAVHELAHIMTTDVGHTPSFWANFRFLLREAIDIDLYRKVDFDSSPSDYCGIKISSSVL
jgi:predicted metal-dependent hydrolase